MSINDIDESKIDESKIDESKIDESKIDESKIDESKIDESKIDESKIDKSKIDKSKTDLISDNNITVYRCDFHHTDKKDCDPYLSNYYTYYEDIEWLKYYWNEHINVVPLVIDIDSYQYLTINKTRHYPNIDDIVNK